MKLSRFSLILGLAVAIVACEAPVKETKELTSGLYPEYMDTTVRPGDDFHSYVNGGWIKKH